MKKLIAALTVAFAFAMYVAPVAADNIQDSISSDDGVFIQTRNSLDKLRIKHKQTALVQEFYSITASTGSTFVAGDDMNVSASSGDVELGSITALDVNSFLVEKSCDCSVAGGDNKMKFITGDDPFHEQTSNATNEEKIKVESYEEVNTAFVQDAATGHQAVSGEDMTAVVSSGKVTSLVDRIVKIGSFMYKKL